MTRRLTSLVNQGGQPRNIHTGVVRLAKFYLNEFRSAVHKKHIQCCILNMISRRSLDPKKLVSSEINSY
jgi:hypothetical protein